MGDAFLMSMESSKGNNDRNKQFLVQIAAWLVDNTGLTFNQIAQCCRLALEEVQDIADEEIEVEKYNPIISGIITEKEIDDCKKNPNRVPNLIIKNIKKRSKAIGSILGFASKARRRDKPDAIYYLVKKFPILDNNVIAKLISTTNYTVEQVRDGSHHNMQNIKPQDPVLLGLCSQENLEAEVEKAKVEEEKQERLKKYKE
ncbi:cell cycle transcriptional regulator TrcR [Wolbachia endosymbiont of Zaprionus taronus]|uniref:cell cycle transcriptional regulator TrcR n=1 Tax=Wolbachia endosymbiont of Zaprionus taronus TaxID=2603208 RepID=UPI002949197A|nr:cell cycle transcriptional regulator TrcR [Wolbachia endosymbiont of Zaprionus taronus]MDV6249002.1 cell cycle transcriptional regulator TrcR [Wolbachia endosymbiont of Zaprionus taronus]